MEKNPYSLVFGKEPSQIISRSSQSASIITSFEGEDPSQQIYMITGVRGSGKTVFMTEISKKIAQNKDWIVVELNPERDLLTGLAGKLSSENNLASIFKSAKINLSLFGFGLEVTNSVPISDIETALSKMISSLKKHNKRLLITIDEVVSNHSMKEFAAAFQILLRQDLPVYLLMTGLYENINKLQNEQSLTFLYRAPKIYLRPLNLSFIEKNYKNNLDISTEQAREMARLTKGFPFAFQVLGYFTWENKGDYHSVMDDYTLYLYDYVYEKIWAELSETDQRIAYGIAASQTGKIKEIRECLGISTNQFNPYRKRLMKKGILNGEKYGYVEFTLPLFEKFVLENYL